LNGLFKLRYPDLVEDEGEDYGHREADEDAQQAHCYRVAYDTREERVFDKLPEIRKPRPRAEAGHVSKIVFLERHEYPVHGYIHKQENECYAREDKQL
jgi:hypothetical protein